MVIYHGQRRAAAQLARAERCIHLSQAGAIGIAGVDLDHQVVVAVGARLSPCPAAEQDYSLRLETFDDWPRDLVKCRIAEHGTLDHCMTLIFPARAALPIRCG